MLNIFNLFLFLFAVWLVLMSIWNHISWLYLFCGLAASALVTLASIRLKLIEKDRELLYLNFGFYRHFFNIFFGNFFSAIKIILRLSLKKEPLYPVIQIIKNNDTNLGLLVASINMTSGIFCIDCNNDNITIHALDQDYFKALNLKKIVNSLNDTKDENLI